MTMVSWMAIVFRGYQPAAIHNALAYTIGYQARFDSYAMLMRDEYPPIGDEIPVEIDPPAATEAIATEEPASLEPGASPAQGDAAGGGETPPPAPPRPPAG